MASPQTTHNDKVSPATVAKALKGIDFPRSKQEVVDYAREHGNTQENPDLLTVLQRLPDRQYGSMADVEKGVGKAE